MYLLDRIDQNRMMKMECLRKVSGCRTSAVGVLAVLLLLLNSLPLSEAQSGEQLQLPSRQERSLLLVQAVMEVEVFHSGIHLVWGCATRTQSSCSVTKLVAVWSYCCRRNQVSVRALVIIIFSESPQQFLLKGQTLIA